MYCNWFSVDKSLLRYSGHETLRDALVLVRVKNASIKVYLTNHKFGTT